MTETNPEPTVNNPQLDRRLNDIGWGLLMMLTSAIGLLPPATVSQLLRTDPPLVAIFLLVIGTSLVARPLFTRTA